MPLAQCADRERRTQVDDVDVAMSALQEDGRRPFTEIARSLDLSEGTVRQRVGRLERLGIVQIVGCREPFPARACGDS